MHISIFCRLIVSAAENIWKPAHVAINFSQRVHTHTIETMLAGGERNDANKQASNPPPLKTAGVGIGFIENKKIYMPSVPTNEIND